MRLLLDTCIVYDWLMGAINDAPTIERVTVEGAYVSPVTVWEMVIKHGLGKLALPTLDLGAEIEAQGFMWLNITPYHAQTVLELPDHHKDPFDRMLIAQAKHEAMCIATYDTVFQRYPIDVLAVPR